MPLSLVHEFEVRGRALIVLSPSLLPVLLQNLNTASESAVNP